MFVDILSIDDAIRVEHGDDFEDVGLSQALGYRITAAQELQRALQYPAGIALSWMNPCCQHHTWPVT